MQIHFASRVESTQYQNCLETLNYSVLHNLNEIKENALLAHSSPVDFDTQVEMAMAKQSNPGADRIVQKHLKDMLKNLTEVVELTGFVNPMNKVYALNKPLENLPVVFALLTLYSYDYVHLSAQLGTITTLFNQKDKDPLKIDGPVFIVGMLTIFKQFHPVNEATYINLLCHFFKNDVFKQRSQGVMAAQLTRDSSMTLAFLDEIMRFKHGSRETVNQILGTYVFDTYKRQVAE